MANSQTQLDLLKRIKLQTENDVMITQVRKEQVKKVLNEELIIEYRQAFFERIGI
ncbi:hypothetical protein C2G38_2161903 [Gigaspora rosea]|uniref:Uncharacterized protein n=1 Tax=Gigaspora rosea TaxID=44941 RepID=A0A397VWH5_9GLOM|nr:hypothetical protein C2G38_2161903 [Gigaspora rosea]